MKSRFFPCLVLACLLASVSNAAIIVTTGKSADSSPPSVSATDLAQTEFLSITAGFDGLVNGVIGNTDGDTSDPGEVGMTTSSVFTINFDVSTNTLGYDITRIDSVFGWNPASGGRSNQGYSIGLTFVDDSTATLLNATHWEPNSPSEYWTVVSFTNSGGGALFSDTYNLNGGGATASNSVLASGVKAITIDITSPSNAGGGGGLVVGREFDIYGVATVPEPGTLALMGIAFAALVALRRRR